ncbi:MAG: dihydroorotase [Clostridiales bacterium]|nr:dihydroorotase [Clostridiales bacterium]
MRIILTNCKVYNDSTKTKIFIEDGKFANEFAEDKADKVIDLKGATVTPGLVDMHCHLREPGGEYKETIKTGTASAAKGGYTSICPMPNTNPVADNAAVISGILKKAKEADNCRVYPIGAATKGIDGELISEMGLMKEAGIVAVSDDGHPIKNAGIMRKVMEYSSDFDLPVLNHCEDKSLSEGAMNEGVTSTTIGIRGIPTAAEDIMIARDIILSEYLDIPVHICHVSTKGGVRMIRDAKARGVKVTCETCPHYFTLTDDMCETYDTNFKMHPPLRTRDHVDAIIEGIKDGTIDAIATDNAPHHADEKVCEFSVALNGILGFETAFALGYTYLVKTGEITLEKLIDLMSLAPSKILKLGRGTMNVGDDADLAAFDLDNEFVFDKEKMLSKSRNTPYDGWKLYGETILTMMGGKVTYDKLC